MIANGGEGQSNCWRSLQKLVLVSSQATTWEYNNNYPKDFTKLFLLKTYFKQMLYTDNKKKLISLETREPWYHLTLLWIGKAWQTLDRALHYITINYIILHFITLHYITLLYITLHYITVKHCHFVRPLITADAIANCSISHLDSAVLRRRRRISLMFFIIYSRSKQIAYLKFYPALTRFYFRVLLTLL